jgi:hypothetical protein
MKPTTTNVYERFNRIVFSIFLISITSQNFAQTTIDERTKVKNYVTNQIKNSLEFPKHFKTEKITVELISKGKPANIPFGSSKDIVAIDKTPKYFKIKVDTLLGIGFQKNKLNEIFKLAHDSEYNYYTIFYKKFDNVLDSFIYEGSNDIVLFSKKSVIKYLDSEYSVNIWYWAMSKGGKINLYNDKGTAYVDKKGVVVSFYIDEATEE